MNSVNSGAAILVALAGGLTAEPADKIPEWRLEIVPSALSAFVSWKYTTEDPGDGWWKPDFDDSKWEEGVGGFGSKGTPGLALGTVWTRPRIWLRREFSLPDPVPAGMKLRLVYDEDPVVYLNGEKAAELKGWVTDYQETAISEQARSTLKPGANLMAVTASQTSGGQGVDVGLVAPAPADASRWSPEKAWQWYKSSPWPVGFNYVPGNSISYTEMWMEPPFDPAVIDRELALAEEMGFNCLRVVLSFVVWEDEPEAFAARFDRFLAICARRGIRVMPCFFDDCVFGPIEDPEFGPQPELQVGWYANGWTPSPGHRRVRDPQTRAALEKFVKQTMRAHREDPRILCWDLYNECGNSSLGNGSLSLLQDSFRWAREVAPVQPVTSGIYGGPKLVEDFILTHSDVITFHNYSPGDHLDREITSLKKQGRPLICTEWLNRPLGSTVEDCLPVFLRHKVGALNWGLVNGKTQTHLNWGHKPGDPEPPLWQHDLFRPDFTAYKPDEIKAFKQAVRRAAAGE